MATKEPKQISKTDIYNIDPDILVLVEDPNHPSFDERIFLPTPEWLVKSVDEDGVINPIKVKLEGENYIVVDGRQRVKAARVANARRKERGEVPVRVPCHPMRADDKTQTRMMVKLNEHRQEDDPITRAKKMTRLLNHGYSVDDVADHFAKTVSFVEQHLALLDCAADVQRAVIAGNMSVTAAVQFATLPREQQSEALKNVLGEDDFANAQAVDLSVYERKANGEQVQETALAPAKKKISVKDAMRAAKEVNGEQPTATASAPSKKDLKKAVIRLEDLAARKNVDHDLVATIRYTLEWVMTGSYAEAPEDVLEMLDRATGVED